MAGKVTFSIDLFIKGKDALPKLAAKIKDPTPLWQKIVEDWANYNIDKFSAAEGAEETGAQVDPGGTVFWEPLSPKYMRRKRKLGYRDQIMVATGELLASLTDPSRFFQLLDPERVIFGTPNDPDDLMKVIYNWERRQTIFLSEPDQQRIRSAVVRYLQVPKTGIRQQRSQMDIDFGETAGGPNA
jgi:hypothetical protein